MADLNVFQLTNQELQKTSAKSEKATKKSVSKKAVKESVFGRRSKKARKPFRIPANKLQFESLHRFLEDDGEDTEVTADYTPDDEVVVVIDPEMDEVPEDTEEAVEAAEELIGQHVCKCAICGANYVTDTEITEEVEIEDQECPVCGETGDQIVVGVITATDELSDEDKEDTFDVEDEEEVEVEDEDGDVEFDEFEDEEETEESDDDFEESVRRQRMRTMRRRSESVRRRPMGKKRTVEGKTTRLSARRSTRRMPTRVAENRKFRSSKASVMDYGFDEATFNRMLTRFAKENYSNIKSVRISDGSIRNGILTLEGVVTTTKGSKRAIKFVSERFTPSKRMTLKFKEYGPFTESVRNAGYAFILECACVGKKIVPAALRYSYTAKESKNTYSVSGKVLSESVRNKKR